MSSQVVTFYEDKEMTKAILPRTKISAISDDSGTALSEMVLYHGDGIDSRRALIDADLLQGHNASYFTSKSDFDTKVNELNNAIANSGKFYGIDTGRALSTTVPYTATEDCMAFVSIQEHYGNGTFFVDDVAVVSYDTASGTKAGGGTIPLKKGQTLTRSGATGFVRVFGLKG